jgi:rubrerythrin
METARRGEYPYYACPVCGFTAEKEAPETCPVCGAKGKVFKKIG